MVDDPIAGRTGWASESTRLAEHDLPVTMIGMSSEAERDNDFVVRRARKHRRMIMFGAVPLLAVMLAAVVAPIVFAVDRDLRAARVRRQEQEALNALLALPYPQSPVPSSESRLERIEHLGGMNVFTPFLPLTSEPMGIVLQIRSRESFGGRNHPSPTVMLVLAGTGKAVLPQSSFRSCPLRLAGEQGEVHIYSTEFQAWQLAKFKEPEQNSVMHFTVPTESFLEWIRKPNPSGGISDITFSVSSKGKLVLDDFAATLRPVVPVTDSPN